MNLADRIKLSCLKYSEKQFFFEDELITYSQLWERASKVRKSLESLGVQPGDRIALQLPKCLEFLYVHLANLQLGSITVPLNPSYTQDEISYFLSDSGAKIFITIPDHVDFAQPGSIHFPELQAVIVVGTSEKAMSFSTLLSSDASDAPFPAQSEDTALIIYTSGTTGRSKGAMLSHKNLLFNLEALHTSWGHSDQDVLLHVLPIFHIHGLLVAFHGALHAGMKIVMRSRFDPIDVLTSIQNYQCTVFMGVPTMYHRLLQVNNPESFNLDSMRLWVSGSAPLSTTTLKRFEQVFKHSILERYGMSETGMNVSNPLNGIRKPGSVGLPLPGVALRILDSEKKDVKEGEVGEIWIKGDNVFKGYWKMPQKTAESFWEGWFKTGDLGYQDHDGYLYLVGRSKDLIISGGMNVYPKEIESLIDTVPTVEETAVIGIPDDDLGERVVAVLVPRNNRRIDLEEVEKLCKNNLAGYKRPKNYFITKELPRNAMGKVMKNQLRIKYSKFFITGFDSYESDIAINQ